MNIPKEQIKQAIDKVKEAQKDITPHHYCDECFVKYLHEFYTNKKVYASCMSILREVNRTFGTKYDAPEAFCDYGHAVSYKQLHDKVLNIRVAHI
jgi:hypothetical protein